MNGNGAPISLGPNTVNALLNHNAFQYKHNRIIAGQTTELTGNFGVNMEGSVFHVGRTNVNYSINCASGNCNVTYELFANDGFWDVDYIDENTLGRIPYIRDWTNTTPDRLGPNLERFGGNPYPYIPTIRIFTFPNPGY